MPRTSTTQLTYRVPYADTDQMGIVYYANFLIYFERSRNEALRSLGLTYREMESEGILLPVIEAHCRYLQPALYDDLLEIHGWFELEGRTRVRACCEVRRGETLLAEGYTIHACLSRETRRPVRLPGIFLPSGNEA
ncbi:MAG: acyl-CoA thioesterase [Verrucomicrobiae bacterium]|nr:acyl-CoA thioesterase [Verrucomicrobiae bacterium]